MELKRGSFAPEDFAPGFFTKGNATIRNPRVAARPFPGKDKYFLWLLMDLEPDEDTGFDTFTARWYGGFLSKGVPSQDGETPAGDDYDFYSRLAKGEESVSEDDLENYAGPYILGQFTQGTQAHQLMLAFKDAQFTNWSDNVVDMFDGLKCFWHQVAQARSGAPKEGEKEYSVLVPGQILDGGSSASGGSKKTSGNTNAGKASSGTNAKAGANGNGDVESLVESAGGEILAAAEGPMKLQQFIKSVLPKTGAHKTQAFQLLNGNNSEWVQSEDRPWSFNAKTKEVSM